MRYQIVDRECGWHCKIQIDYLKVLPFILDSSDQLFAVSCHPQAVTVYKGSIFSIVIRKPCMVWFPWVNMQQKQRLFCHMGGLCWTYWVCWQCRAMHIFMNVAIHSDGTNLWGWSGLRDVRAQLAMVLLMIILRANFRFVHPSRNRRLHAPFRTRC